MTTRQSVSAPWKAPVNLGPWINSSFHERNPFVSRNGLILMFSSNRPGSFSHDIWVSQRASAAEPFGPPIPLSPPVNSTHDETAAFFLEDQTMLYFTTSREGWVSHLAQVPILLTSEVDREDAPPQ
jgi:OmpA-OmpF porin, OOP family